MQFPFNLGQFAQTSQSQNSGGNPVQAAVGAVPSWLGQMQGQTGGQFQFPNFSFSWPGQQSQQGQPQQKGFSATGPQGWGQVMQRPMGNPQAQQQAPQTQQQTPQAAQPQQGQFNGARPMGPSWGQGMPNFGQQGQPQAGATGQGAASPFGWMRQAPQMPQQGQGSAPQQGGRFGNMARALVGGGIR